MPLEMDMERTLVGEHSFISEVNYPNFDAVLNAKPVDWKLSDEAIIHLGMPNNGKWIKLSVQNIAPGIQYLLEVDFPTVDSLVAFVPTENGGYTHVSLGESQPFNNRRIAYQTFFIPYESTSENIADIYLYVVSNEQVSLPITISKRIAQFENSVKRDLLFGLYAGVILAMFFYNIFIYVTTRDKSYLYYIIYIFFVGLVQTALAGYGFKYIWPDSPEWQQVSLNVFNLGTAIFAYKFFESFVNLKQVLPKWKYSFYVLLVLYVLQLVLALIGFGNIAYDIMNVSALLLSFLFIVVSILAIRAKVRQAKYFLGAWMFFFSAVIIFVLKDVGVFSYNILTANVLQIGSGLEVVLLSFGLADRINVLKRENEVSQAKSLEVSRENARIIREQNIRLEEKVDERTHELNQALINVQNAQTQLVEQEKLASLGQLTAGIAHEINNPINFVTANVKPLKRDVDDILEVLDAFMKFKTGADFDAGKQELDELIEEIELDFVRSEIVQLLSGIDDGAKRTAEIVRGLKIFARTDEQDIKHVDLIEGIESTLTLLNNSMKGRIEVFRDFDAIPKVECFGGKLNQVFMNILSNAVHAIQEKGTENGQIHISIKSKSEKIEIKIKDNANGIPEEKLKHIFDPFFTTKPIGEGTGLGLSIAKGIIEKHNGTISVNSVQGEGTEFTMVLPVEQTNAL